MSTRQAQGSGATILMVFAVGLVTFGLGWLVGSYNQAPDYDTDLDLTGIEDIGESDDIPVGDSPVLGNENAPVTVVEFTSMQCPFCAQGAETLEELVDKYDGKVRVVFKHFPLPFQQQAEPASRLLVAAQQQDEDAFWDMKSGLFDRLDDYGPDNMEDIGAEVAEEVGLDPDQLLEDFEDSEVAEVVESDQQLGRQLGVQGTPHFFINGEVVNGAKPLDEFADIVDEQLDKVIELYEDGVPEDELYAEAVAAALQADAEPDEPEQAEQPDDAPERPERPEPPAEPEEEPVEVHKVDIRDHDPIKGASEEDALVTIMEFSSFQCPFCARAADTLEQLLERYPDEVRLVFKHFPLRMQEHSEPASRAAVAAGNQGKFWEMYDLIYDNQDSLGESGLFEELAEEIGLDIAEFSEDFEAEETADIVEQGQRDGRSAGIRGTPGFLINGVFEGGAQPLGSFVQHVEEQIEIAEEVRDETGLAGNELHAAIVEHNKEHLADDAAAPEPERQPEPDEPDTIDEDALSVGDSYTKGPDDAPVTIYEFSSFQCPFCARAARTMKQVIDEYEDEVRLVYKNFPLGMQQHSEPAARAALAAGEQGQFWEMHERLFENQDRLGEPGLFEEFARELGLNVDRFKQDFESDDIAQQVEDEQSEGQSVGVTGTPAFFVNGEELSGAQPFGEFQSVIDRHLEQQ